MNDINIQLLKTQYAQCSFNHKIQEVACERLEKNSSLVKWLNIILVFPSLIIFAMQLKDSSNQIYIYFGILISVIVVCFQMFQLSFNYDKESINHNSSALKYLKLREQYKLLISDYITQNKTLQEVLSQRDILQAEYHSICETAPKTKRKDFKETQKRLLGRTSETEDLTWSNEEIDRILPPEFNNNITI